MRSLSFQSMSGYALCYSLLKPEEEINKYSTGEDLGEVRRSVFILKKGYQSQKISVRPLILDSRYRLFRTCSRPCRRQEQMRTSFLSFL